MMMCYNKLENQKDESNDDGLEKVQKGSLYNIRIRRIFYFWKNNLIHTPATDRFTYLFTTFHTIFGVYTIGKSY